MIARESGTRGAVPPSLRWSDADRVSDDRAEYYSDGGPATGTIVFEEVNCDLGSEILLELDATLDSEIEADTQGQVTGTV